MHRFRLFLLTMAMGALVFGVSLALPGQQPADTGASTGADSLTVAQAAPAETANSTDVALAAGGNLIGWFGVDTTSTAILAGNAELTAVWVFAAGAWSSDSALLPDGLRTALLISRGTGVFIVAAAATDLTVPTGSVLSTDLFLFNDATVVVGAATFTRSLDGASITASPGDDLIAGNAHTMWWVIWNDPTQCAVACGGADLGVPGNTVLFGDGQIANAAGTATFRSSLTVGGPMPGGPIPGALTDPITATIHLVIRDHGPSLVGDALIAQIGSFETDATDAESTGDGFAWDVQAAISDGSNTTVSSLEVFQSAAEVAAENIGEETDGESTVTRTATAIQITIVDRELIAGNAYSVWALIDQPNVDNPSAHGPGSVFDLAMNVAGGVADADGVLTFNATITVGEAVVADDGTGRQVLVPGTLVDPTGANVRLVVKDHGPSAADEAALDIQMMRLDGPECPCADPHQSFHNP